MNHSLTLHKKLYSLYKEKGVHETRRQIVHDFTDGRTDNSSNLSHAEIISLINILQGGKFRTDEPKTRTVNKLFSLCYTYGWKYYDEAKQRYVVDVSKLNGWLQKYGKYKKPLQDHTPKEMGIVTAQFEMVVNKFLKTL